MITSGRREGSELYKEEDMKEKNRGGRDNAQRRSNEGGNDRRSEYSEVG